MFPLNRFVRLALACALLVIAVAMWTPPMEAAFRHSPVLILLPLAVYLIILALLVLDTLRPQYRRAILRRLPLGLGLVLLGACASGCTGLGGLSAPGTAGSASASAVLGALADTAKAINNACTGTFAANITFAPPLPPVGSLSVNQNCGLKSAGQPAPAAGQ